MTHSHLMSTYIHDIKDSNEQEKLVFCNHSVIVTMIVLQLVYKNKQ